MKPTLFLALALTAAAQTNNWTLEFANHYSVQANIVYNVANNYENKLDLYDRRDAQEPQPTLIYIHGGGWTGGSKEGGFNKVLPYLEMGWNVVNVEYRLAKVSHAPAAVEDCLCALRWVAANAKRLNVDTTRIVVTGDSAGGHLALTTGMIPESAGLDRECPGVALPKVAAIVDWYGITDVNDLLEGPNLQELRGRMARFRAQSPGNCETRVAARIRSQRPSADHHDPRRRRPHSALPAQRSAQGGAR